MNKRRTNPGTGRTSPLAGFFRAFPEEIEDAGTVPKDGEARQEGIARRINWSTVSASTPNIKWNKLSRVPGHARGGRRTRP